MMALVSFQSAKSVVALSKSPVFHHQFSSVTKAISGLASGWSLPFDVRRVKSNEDEVEVAAGQIRVICQSEKFAKSLNINAADSSYGVAKYISKVNDVSNLVNVLRLRHGNKVWTSEYRETGGTPQIYGKQYYLIEESGEKEYRKKEKTYRKYVSSIYEKEADEYEEIERVTKKGKKLKIEPRRWSGMKMRTKNGYSMKEVEFE